MSEISILRDIYSRTCSADEVLELVAIVCQYGYKELAYHLVENYKFPISDAIMDDLLESNYYYVYELFIPLCNIDVILNTEFYTNFNVFIEVCAVHKVTYQILCEKVQNAIPYIFKMYRHKYCDRLYKLLGLPYDVVQICELYAEDGTNDIYKCINTNTIYTSNIIYTIISKHDLKTLKYLLNKFDLDMDYHISIAACGSSQKVLQYACNFMNDNENIYMMLSECLSCGRIKNFRYLLDRYDCNNIIRLNNCYLLSEAYDHYKIFTQSSEKLIKFLFAKYNITYADFAYDNHYFIRTTIDAEFSLIYYVCITVPELVYSYLICACKYGNLELVLQILSTFNMVNIEL